MKTLIIRDIIKTRNAILHKFGLEVYSKVKALIASGEKVTLSFDGLKNVTSGFCNASVGRIYAEYTNANELLFLDGIDQNPIWKEKIDNAIALAKKPDIIDKRNNAISELLKS